MFRGGMMLIRNECRASEASSRFVFSKAARRAAPQEGDARRGSHEDFGNFLGVASLRSRGTGKELEPAVNSNGGVG